MEIKEYKSKSIIGQIMENHKKVFSSMKNGPIDGAQDILRKKGLSNPVVCSIADKWGYVTQNQQQKQA